MAFPKSVKQLCTPAYIYFLLSVIGIIIAIIQNVGNSGVYCLGSMRVPVPSTIMVFVVKIIGILFWTWILNLMCKDGHKEIAWFLVLLPFVLLFFMMGTAEGFQNSSSDIPGICSDNGACDRVLKDSELCGSDACKNGAGAGCPPKDRCDRIPTDLSDCSKCSK
jgi:hypothetical protein